MNWLIEMAIQQRLIPIAIFILVCTLTLQQCTIENQWNANEETILLHAVEEVRIGEYDGEVEFVFGSIIHLAIGKNGELFVADNQVPIIRMFDKNGNFLRNVGRQGRGPGEYLRIGGVRSFPDGRLAIWDLGNLRVTVYDRSGNFVESHLVNGNYFSADIFEVDHSGNFYVRTVLRNTPDMPNWKFGWLKVSPKGELIDTIRVPLDLENREQTFVLFTASGNAHPFIEWPLSSMSAKGHLITGRNDNYVLQINRPHTTPIVIERDYTPVEIKQEERVQWENWVNHYSVNNSIPETKPVYKSIQTDSQGRIWIQKYVEAVYTEDHIGPHFGPESNLWEPPTFDVFFPDGSYHATTRLPLNANFRDAKNDHVWAVVKGELDELYVVRYKLEERTE